jgi:hypothetical protein
MHKCPVCEKYHSGEYQVCAKCLKATRKRQNVEHHPDCPNAWHDQARCNCVAIKGSRYE